MRGGLVTANSLPDLLIELCFCLCLRCTLYMIHTVHDAVNRLQQIGIVLYIVKVAIHCDINVKMIILLAIDKL